MFRPQIPDDISHDEYEKYVLPHTELVEEYLKTYLIPDYIANIENEDISRKNWMVSNSVI